ncbi:chromatin assembly factor 1 subunit a [Diplodia corticola]|uniref:Chromatin assembly factor 1 subunit a n=1 Tax=Diplodia corticola TaxID=236234 RepID=A0A1J9QX64_9PEZI|nr:chromatin assembly factor 1 subunit a [Diplodia corticola]OJD32977.1 chromatin assembly factor 1 subunit a [Diplodia corticola]
MADTLLQPASPSRKRPAPDDLDMPDIRATPVKDAPSSPQSSNLSTPKSIASPDQSPLPQGDTAQTHLSPAPSNLAPTATANSSTTGATSTKRRRLTTQEKEEKAKAREEKRLQKEEETRQKEEAKKLKEEAKKLKDEESRKKKEEAEARKREKEMEKQRKAEEQEKKAKAQPKLNQWFTMRGPGNTTAELPHRRKSVSAEPGEPAASPSKPPSPQKKVQSDYEQTFLPYEKKTHEILAPQTLFWADRSDADREAAIARLNGMAASGSEHTKQQVLNLLEKRDFSTLLGIPAAERGKRGVRYPLVRDIVAQLQGSSDQPVDLTEETSEKKMRGLLETLKAVPMKYIHFTEDVRPPYCGTFTKIQSDRESRRLAIKPFLRSLPEANYDYDSECEWEEPEEGEDLDAEDEEDLDSDGAEDLEDFLEDDDEAAHSKRRLITGDLEPVSTGLCWEDSKGVLRKADGSCDSKMTLSEFRMGVLLEPRPKSIDPFSTAYWETQPQPASSSETKHAFGTMQPPRLPLHARPENGADVNVKLPAKTANGSAGVPKPPKRTIPVELMAEFKDAIKGSDLTKIALIEALKKRFPKVPKDAITNTLSLVAKRVGPSAAEKRWTLLDT